MRLWGKVIVCGIDYKVYFTSQDITPQLRGLDGLADMNAGIIYLAECDNPTRSLDTLVHELLHTIFEASGLAQHLRQNLKKGVKISDFEEQLIRILTPSLIVTLKSAGLMSRKSVK